MPQPLLYLDNAASTPLRPEVREAMLPYLAAGHVGNPSSPHRSGREAAAAIDEARRRVRQALRATHYDVVFTSGGTEANNLAVVGTALSTHAQGRPVRIAISAVEHKSVPGATATVQSLGGEVIVLPVDHEGLLNLAALQSALREHPSLVSVMGANNETGVVQDMTALASLCRDAGVPLHCDAVQAFGKLDVDLGDLRCPLLTISGHKIGAPKGIGALLVRHGFSLVPLIRGGSQQKGVRPGTENLTGIVALGCAAELAAQEVGVVSSRVRELRDTFERIMLERLPDAVIHGRDTARVAHISLFSVPGTTSDVMLMHLDLAGIACSSGSACTTGAVEPSHVLTAMGVEPELGAAALRFSFWHHNTLGEVRQAADVLHEVAVRIRSSKGALSRA